MQRHRNVGVHLLHQQISICYPANLMIKITFLVGYRKVENVNACIVHKDAVLQYWLSTLGAISQLLLTWPPGFDSTILTEAYSLVYRVVGLAHFYTLRSW